MSERYQRINEETEVVFGLQAPVEIHASTGCDMWGFTWVPFTHDEFEQVIRFWLEDLPEDERHRRIASLTACMTEADVPPLANN